MKTKKMPVGIDNYSLFPLKLKPLELLQWAKDNGAEGVSFSGLEPEHQKIIDDAYLRDLKDFARENDLYLEWGGASHIPRQMNIWEKVDVFSINKKAAEQAEKLGVRIVRSCSGGLMRWEDDSPQTEFLLRETEQILRAQKKMLEDHNVILAIETHFEFTTFELLRIFEEVGAEPGGYVGICLDTMNLLTMLEHPVKATERVLPWIVSTHIKDGGILTTRRGLRSFVTEVGKGAINFRQILKRLSVLSQPVNLNIEDHGGDFDLPIFDPFFLSKFPDLTTAELTGLLEIAEISRRKIENGECSVLDRKDWPTVCEERVKRDIAALKRLREEFDD